MKRLNKSGITLLSAVLLIIVASVVVLSTTVFIVERLSQEKTYQLRTQCVYLAQAGIHNAVYNYRFNDLAANGYFTKGQTNIDANNFFVLGANAADALMVNTVGAAIGPPNSDLTGLRIQNATNSNTITIDRMVVTWNNPLRTLQQIRINGSNVFNGNLASPANANITNFTLNTTPTIYNINRIRFSGNINVAGLTISIQFVMTDGSSKTLTVYPDSSNNSFIVKATGKKTGSSIYRTIQATYNAVTGRITSYNEIPAQITP
ncbi:MAG: hypothetical protein WCL25_03120 [bacterium]